MQWGMCDDQNCLLPTQSFSATQILRTIGMDLPFVIILSIYAVVITIKLSRFRHILQDCIYDFVAKTLISNFSKMQIYKAVYSAYKKWRHTKQMSNDRLMQRLSYQRQASIHFNWPMVGQFDVILLICTIKIYIHLIKNWPL